MEASMYYCILMLMEEKGMSYGDLADVTGIPKATLQRYMTGSTSKVPVDRLEKIANALSITLAQLINCDKPSAPAARTPSFARGVKIPVLGRVVAGIPIEATQEILDYEEIPQSMADSGEYFGLQIKGESMEPKFSPGDVVIVRKQPDVENGEIAIVLVNGSEATVKKIKKFSGGINLVPNNPAYDVITYTDSEIESLPVRIIGKVVELRAKF